MEEYGDQGTPEPQVAQANARAGADPVTSPATQIGTDLANLNVATADSVRADAYLLGLDRLLDLPLDLGANFRDQADYSDSAFPFFHDDDLPAPLFHDDDLPVPVFHDDDLPAPLLHEHDFPADLTAFGLGELLGLDLSGFARPTVGEVVHTAIRQTQARDTNSEDDESANEEQDDDADGDADEHDIEKPDSSSAAGEAGDLSFIDSQSLTEKAETEDAEVAHDEKIDADLINLDLPLLAGEIGFADGIDVSFVLPAAPVPAATVPAATVPAPPVPAGGGGGAGGGSSGGGVTVINGTAGDDDLIGTAGDDIIHGFAGNDVIDGGAGSDRLDGGQGDDVLLWDSADEKIDGKNGSDTLRVDGENADFTAFAGTLSGLEVVELQNGAAITLSAQDVLDATDNGNTLTILGDAGESLHSGGGWTYNGMSGGNHIYTQDAGPKTATLVVDPDVTVVV